MVGKTGAGGEREAAKRERSGRIRATRAQDRAAADRSSTGDRARTGEGGGGTADSDCTGARRGPRSVGDLERTGGDRGTARESISRARKLEHAGAGLGQGARLSGIHDVSAEGESLGTVD